MFSFLKKNKDKDNQVVENSEVSENFFSKAFSKTFASIKSVVPQKKEKISFEEIEEILIEADVEYEIIEKAMNGLPSMISRKELRHRLVMLFEHAPNVDLSNIPKPYVRLIIGVNGAGKTTTIAKLAAKLKKEGQSVILGAGDTFRAGSIDQLKVWGERVNVEVVSGPAGGDPAAVVFDAVKQAKNQQADILMVDTAGRLQNKVNLMNELEKMKRVIDRELPDTPLEVLLVLDATTGQNAMLQAKQFKETTDVTGLVLTKLDGTAKGGIVLAIRNELNIPVKYVGLGEGMDDLQVFDPNEYVFGLFSQLINKEN